MRECYDTMCVASRRNSGNKDKCLLLHDKACCYKILCKSFEIK
jgi:hypothetical protein